MGAVLGEKHRHAGGMTRIFNDAMRSSRADSDVGSSSSAGSTSPEVEQNIQKQKTSAVPARGRPA